jgi:hypothetical protein
MEPDDYQVHFLFVEECHNGFNFIASNEVGVNCDIVPFPLYCSPS